MRKCNPSSCTVNRTFKLKTTNSRSWKKHFHSNLTLFVYIVMSSLVAGLHSDRLATSTLRWNICHSLRPPRHRANHTPFCLPSSGCSKDLTFEIQIWERAKKKGKRWMRERENLSYELGMKWNCERESNRNLYFWRKIFHFPHKTIGTKKFVLEVIPSLNFYKYLQSFT